MSDSAPGKVYGSFRVLSQLGAGAQGAVFRAESQGHPRLPDGTIVALKVIPQELAGGRPDALLASYRPLLEREIHPALVRYLDAFLDQSEGKASLCAVMEHVEGRPLSDLIAEKTGGVIWDRAWPILEQALAALEALVAAGLLHRDLKPGNVFLLPDGRVKIIDLDLAPKSEAGGDEDRTVAWQGSLEYMAPDFLQVKGFSGDETSDVFSFAVLAFELVSGARPFGDLGERPDLGYVQRWRQGNDTHPDFRASPFRILDGLQAALQRALRQERDQRTPTFAALRADLAQVRSRVLEFPDGEAFELLDLLGRGGFGEVYKARRRRDQAVVAVKHLHSQEYSKRFLKEAAILRQYAHPNIVGYGGLFSRESRGGEAEYFLVMEFLAGETLDKRIKRAPDGLPAPEVARMFIAYCRALHHLHASEHQIIHRDIKPGNLYAPDGQPEQAKLFDLGIARDVSGTQTFGHIPGTLNYMAPEFALADGGRGTPQSDIYALGFCLYESLVGNSVVPKLPRDLDQAYIAFFKRSQRPLVIDFDKPVFREHPGLMRVVARSLAYDPASRYASAAEMEQDLSRVLNPSAGGETGDYSVTLGQVISPKLVIDQKWVDENMKDWDDSKFVPPVLPSQVGHAAAPGGRGLFYTLLVALLAAIGGVVYLKFIRPPEVQIQGVDAEWAARLLRETGAAREVSDLTGLEAVWGSLRDMRAQPEAAESAVDLDAIEQALRGRALGLASNLHAEATGLIARADFSAAAERLDRLSGLAAFAEQTWKLPEASAWLNDAEQRLVASRQAMTAQAEARAAFLDRLRQIAASAGDARASRGAAEAVVALPEADWAAFSVLPEAQESLRALRAAVTGALQADIAREDDPEGRSARLSAWADWLPGKERALDLPAAQFALSEARRRFLWQVANPTPLPLSLGSPLVPADTVVPAGGRTLVALHAEQPTEITVQVLAGPAYQPVPIRLAITGGGGAVTVLPELPLKSVPIQAVPAAYSAGAARPKLVVRPSGADAWTPYSDAFPPLPPGRHALRFERADFQPIERALDIAPGSEVARVVEPPESEWIPTPALALLQSLEALAATPGPALAEKLADPRLRELAWPAHRERLAALQAAVDAARLAAIPAAVEAAWLALDDFFGWLVQLRDPMSAARARFRGAEPFAGAPPRLALPAGWESASLPAETTARIRMLAPFQVDWESVVTGPGRPAAAAALRALSDPLAQDAAAALATASVTAGPPAGATSALAHRWRAHLAFERDFVSAETVLRHLEAMAAAGGRANAHDALLAFWAAHAVWLNAVESVKDDTRLGGKRHAAESEQAVGVLRRTQALLDPLSAAEMEQALRLLREKTAATPALQGAPLLVLNGFARARGGAAWKGAWLAAAEAEKSAWESSASPADQTAWKRRLANLQYLLLEAP
jgi:serine/threonine protein kinase